MSSTELFKFAKIPLGDFESCLAFVETLRFVDFQACADMFLRQTYRTFVRLLKGEIFKKNFITLCKLSRCRTSSNMHSCAMEQSVVMIT